MEFRYLEINSSNNCIESVNFIARNRLFVHSVYHAVLNHGQNERTELRAIRFQGSSQKPRDRRSFASARPVMIEIELRGNTWK